MLTRKTDMPLLVLIVLLAAVIGGLPFGHQLAHDSLGEPEHCLACLLQSGLSLLFAGSALALAVLNASEPNSSARRTVPLPLFTPRFTHLNRGPPRC